MSTGPLFSRILQEASLLLWATLVLRGLSALSTILLTRFLPERDYGAFAYGQSIAIWLMFGASIGLPTYIFRRIGEASHETEALFLRSLQLVSVLAVMGITVIAALFLLNLLPRDLFWLVFPVASSGAFMACNLVMQSFLRAAHHVGRQTALMLIQGGLIVLVVPTSAYQFQSGVVTAKLWFAVFATMCLLHLILAWRDVDHTHHSALSLKQLTRKTLPFAGLDWTLASFPLIISTGLMCASGVAMVGVFSAGYVVYGAVIILAVVLDQIFLNEIAKSSAEAKRRVERLYLQFAGLIGLSVATLVFFSSGFLAALFFAEFHGELKTILQLLCLPIFFRFLTLAASCHSRVSGDNRSVLRVYGIATLLLIAATPFAVHWGIFGAVIALVLTESCIAFIFLFCSWRTYTSTKLFLKTAQRASC